ncbi:alpha/beta fold hydrolase [Paenibacillus typhae]|uniref:Alpha/beta hydrolase family protein n=1 Tax=Paenibacillus typhae TaxID=1174501 RepID=A0A1G9GF73_9BACL|nr:alpha/beta hydrolase [Paenibacillus typhae]SDK99232.1 Alpha/beta hydrolase family protein [Paenibacillus typhae]
MHKHIHLESGMGMSRSCWGLVQPLIGEATRAVVYDRAGIGRSEADSAPQTLARIAGDLSFLLQQLGSGPFILVGHSRGDWLSVLWQPHLAPP